MTPTLIPGTGTPASKVRELPPFVGSLLSQWDARHAGDGAAQPNSRASDPLTARERDVLALISQGLSNKRIARALEISPETVKSHIKHIFLKLAVGTRAEAVSRAGLLGLLPYGADVSRAA
jgi:LuxR family maltose regulon positive regulatory protein